MLNNTFRRPDDVYWLQCTGYLAFIGGDAPACRRALRTALALSESMEPAWRDAEEHARIGRFLALLESGKPDALMAGCVWPAAAF